MRVGTAGTERPALLDENGALRDLSRLIEDVDGSLFDGGPALDGIRLAAESGTLPVLEDAGLRTGPPVAGIGKIVGIGLNKHDHARETGAPVPGEPIVFLKAPDTVVGPEDPVLIPRGSRKTDWEAELAVVIGRTARYLETDEDARAVVAGYTLAHDVSEREFQTERGGQWDKGKNCETFTPLGPWLVTTDELTDPQTLGVRLRVNGVTRQDGNTAEQIFPVAEVIRRLSHYMALHPGDVVLTGTPAGVAMGMPEPRPYLRAGDVVELEIDGLGRQRQELKDA